MGAPRLQNLTLMRASQFMDKTTVVKTTGAGIDPLDFSTGITCYFVQNIRFIMLGEYTQTFKHLRFLHLH